MTAARETFSLDEKYSATDGTILLTGVQALVRLPVDQIRADAARGLNVAGMISGYRGSPLAGLDMLIQRNAKLLQQHNVVFKPGVNEDLAATMIWGSQIAHFFPNPKHDGVIGMWYGKAPGVDRSGDIFKHANLGGVGPHGGVLVVAGDDPYSKSSTLPSRSDVALYDANMPVLAPANVQDVLDFGRYGFELSRYAGLWVGFKIDTHVADELATAVVAADRVSIQTPDLTRNGRPWRPSQTNTIGAPGSVAMEQEIHEMRLHAATVFAATNKLNQITINPPDAWLGVVASGKNYFEAKQALRNLGFDDDAFRANGIRLLKLGMAWPLEAGIVREFARGLSEIIVVEEKRGFIEMLMRDALYALPDRPRIVGKHDDRGTPLVQGHAAPDAATLMPVFAARLSQRLPSSQFEPALQRLRAAQQPAVISLGSNDAQRGAYFCSGCPHNRSTQLPAGSLAGAGIGCHGLIYAMGNREHLGLGHMGGEGAQWVGAAPFSNTPHLFQNLGDGTLFHSGSLAIRQAVASGENITYKVLYNAAVGMTGGQQVDGTMSVPALTRMLQAEGVRKIIVTSDEPDKYATQQPEDAFAPGVEVMHRDRLEEAQVQLREVKGTSVLIHDQMCAAEKRRRRKRGTLIAPKTRVLINERVCEGCGDCGVKSNCLSVHPVETEFGRKTRIHQSSCNKDYSCLNGDCPAFVTIEVEEDGSKFMVHGSKVVQKTDLAPLPEPALGTMNLALSTHNVYIMGIGGTGVVTINQILGTAAMLDGLHVDGMDQTGLSQKGGPVVSHLKISALPNDGANLVYAGEADAYLAFDVLTAARAQDLLRADPARTVAVVNTGEVPTGGMVRNVDVHFPQQNALLNVINSRTRAADNVFINAQALADESIGDHMAANMIVLGAAYQRGLLPVSANAIHKAIELNGVQVQMNLHAFRLGREQVLGARHTTDAPKTSVAGGQGGNGHPNAANGKDAQAIDLQALIDRRVQELTAYQNAAYAGKYAQFVQKVRAAEAAISADTRLSEAVARNLFKLMAYKDEYEVARLYLGDEFRKALSEMGAHANLRYHLHPPFLRALGMKQKLKLGRWFGIGFRALAAMKVLRGTPLDVFGASRHRREERALVGEYQSLIEKALATLDLAGYDRAVSLAESPDVIRGYEDVKSRNVAKWRATVAQTG